MKCDPSTKRYPADWLDEQKKIVMKLSVEFSVDSSGKVR
jgi:hypothetical protein